MAQETNYHAICDEETFPGVPQGVDIQMLRQAMPFRINLDRQVTAGGVMGR